ncbi:50S ribosomal protein L24e [Metallosphaera hakonensis]|uniref:Large ribosomal subunit protein eL24 n=1 Tax=Metallosphaera hakonensis JCM 8857 = DSM 7519 TaxID=1293036 RepID=A0A2U9IU38_9CREN|nr:50S ribosomal protein L24e [Metallosphaera hakonensis]AWR99493.1 50S ribosomal protein L24e [Metallosphaera hakonensis JCM 8857 = DSM 7519]
MVVSHKCSFCGGDIPPATGMMHVRNDGTILWFCSSKCRKYMLNFKKDAKKLKWTTSYSRVR